jgi:hypothetical protein
MPGFVALQKSREVLTSAIYGNEFFTLENEYLGVFLLVITGNGVTS